MDWTYYMKHNPIFCKQNLVFFVVKERWQAYLYQT
jgi:hypothetical protein